MRILGISLALFLLTGCDPMISIQGSFWPAWIVCIFLGLLACAVQTWFFARLKLAPHLGPPVLIYPSLWALNTFILWLAFYAE